MDDTDSDDAVGEVVLPGDVLVLSSKAEDSLPSTSRARVVCGPGLTPHGDNLLVIKCGVVKRRDPATYWVDSQQKRRNTRCRAAEHKITAGILPGPTGTRRWRSTEGDRRTTTLELENDAGLCAMVKGDHVIGIVIGQFEDIFKVDVGGSDQASLSFLAFEGATKKNRPNVKVSLLLNLVAMILTPQNDIVQELMNLFPFEMVVGMNGRIWVKAQTMQQTLIVASLLEACEYLTAAQRKETFAKFSDSM
uniref:Exosome complex component RRP40 N-terminal domain-containing protein n=2 Tax=Pyxicephalus adspersus TaxID=30357 RepID=A0AAV3AAD2_PYXAD|nr:TPA: hypothetical protein GDO54_008598 [Pyxicephalus adspersus]